jgi:hypothetical protein
LGQNGNFCVVFAGLHVPYPTKDASFWALNGEAIMASARALIGLAGGVSAWLMASSPGFAADLGYAAPPPVANKWDFSFTPYGWMINVNGDVTARGHTTDANKNFFQIVDESDSLLAWMSYFEAGRARHASGELPEHRPQVQ